MIIKEMLSLRKDRAKLILEKSIDIKNRFYSLKEDAFINCSDYQTIQYGTYFYIKDTCLLEANSLEQEIKDCKKAMKHFGFSSKVFKEKQAILENHISRYWKLKAEYDKERIDTYYRRQGNYQQEKTVATSKKQISAYEVLGIKPGASVEEVKKAYRIAVKKNHPDNGGSKNQFILVQRAYDFIMERIS